MKTLTKRQKILLGGLAVVIAAWGIDSLTGDAGPQSANAAGNAGDATVAIPTLRLGDIPDLITSLEHDPTQRDPIRGDAGARNPFTLSDDMLRVIDPEAWAQRQASRDRVIAVSAFSEKHTLSTVVLGQRPLAVIDGVILSKGATIDGFTLVEIQADAVILAAQDRRVRLTLPAPGGETSAAETRSPSGP
jgi:hypothetical protein